MKPILRVLVTGRNGQLAMSLNERVAARETIELVCVGRPEIDLADPRATAAAIRDLAPDVVINAAAYTNVDLAEQERELAYRVNAEAAGELAEAAAKIGAPIIQLSTDYVFDGESDRPWREDDPINPVNEYGASKAAGDALVRAANPRHLVLRTSWLVSPFGRNFVRTIVEAARTKSVLRIVSDQRGRPTSALDLAEAILKILDSEIFRDGSSLGRTYHVANDGEASWYEIAREVMAECGRLGAAVANVEPIATSDWPSAARRPRYSVLDCSRLMHDFGDGLPPWPVSVRGIVRRLVAS